MWGSQHAPPEAAARAGERVARCERRLVELREHRPVGPDDVARARASLFAAQSSANVAQGRMLLTRARSLRARSGNRMGWQRPVGRSRSADELAGLRRQVRTIGMHDVYLAAFEVGGMTSLFDFEAFAHGLAGLPEHDARVIEHAVWELEQF